MEPSDGFHVPKNGLIRSQCQNCNWNMESNQEADTEPLSVCHTALKDPTLDVSVALGDDFF